MAAHSGIVWTKVQDAWPFRPLSAVVASPSSARAKGGNGMADARQVAEGFFDAWTGKDFERARGLLHDDVSFAGPIDRFSDADSYLASLRRLSGIVAGAELAHLPVVPGARRQDRIGVGRVRRAALRAAARAEHGA